ncbi:MAG: DNA recombination protein RmuC [Victivallaceae bacterium]|nr:DNA recombination protein RmuC [Victivallaceae bacterium]
MNLLLLCLSAVTALASVAAFLLLRDRRRDDTRMEQLVLAEFARVRDEMANQLKNVSDSLGKTLGILSDRQDQRLEQMRVALEHNLQSIQKDNAEKLEKMRETVDEKLQTTLEKRLSDSFKLVSERLEQVCKGLGEMRSLATGVGDLKRVLTNVKARGTWGEIQLGAMLEEVLTREQYCENVSTKNNTERVEFAVRLPGKGDADNAVLLPIDAKFPVEDYQRILDAADNADPEALENAARQLEVRIKGCAKDISDKYVNPPVTTDFAILYLPTEGLFAEVVRRPGLTDLLQRQYRVVVAGPTTLWSILNSLQMGFRTLAIEKRSSEVWKTLEAVKAEWCKYAEALEAVQKKIQQASESISSTQVRVRAVGRKLREVNAMESTAAADALLDLDSTEK